MTRKSSSILKIETVLDLSLSPSARADKNSITIKLLPLGGHKFYSYVALST